MIKLETTKEEKNTAFEELKLLNTFEAIVLIPRINPIRTKLLPDYKIDWKFSEEKVPMQEFKNKTVKAFCIK